MRICLDSGHYGLYNQSPADSRYYESLMVWKLHLLQKKYLEEYGIEVVVTRPDQTKDRGLYDRGYAAKGCDLFISSHSNAVGAGVNNQVDYPVSYCTINGKADGIGMALAHTVETIMGTVQSARIEHKRGQNGDYYGVLRGAAAAGVPGLILEHSFHTNKVPVQWLLDDENLDRLAKAEADTIALYYGLMPIEKRSGWAEENGGWRFYLGNTGDYISNDWYHDGDLWYWFNDAGMMEYNTWKTGTDGGWYYLGQDGSMARNKWVLWKNELYRVGPDGKMFTGELRLRADPDGVLQIL